MYVTVPPVICVLLTGLVRSLKISNVNELGCWMHLSVSFDLLLFLPLNRGPCTLVFQACSTVAEGLQIVATNGDFLKYLIICPFAPEIMLSQICSLVGDIQSYPYFITDGHFCVLPISSFSSRLSYFNTTPHILFYYHVI